MSGVSVRKGKDAENTIARRLNLWASPNYVFARRGLGHRSLADLVVKNRSGLPTWPFCISVKARQGPTMPIMLASARCSRAWPWWAELEAAGGQLDAWLIWRCDRAWMLSCWTLGGLTAPPRLAVLPTPPGWPRFTMVLDAFLAAVPIADAIKAIREGWGAWPPHTEDTVP